VPFVIERCASKRDRSGLSLLTFLFELGTAVAGEQLVPLSSRQ